VIERLCKACLELSDDEYRKERFASFDSIHRTPNHILVGDRIWVARFEERESGVTSLQEVLYNELSHLWHGRQREDERIIRFAGSVDSAFLLRSIRYTNNRGEEYEDPAPLVIAQVFNHQTHHRAHVHAMLGELGKVPNLDVHRAIRPRSAGPCA